MSEEIKARFIVKGDTVVIDGGKSSPPVVEVLNTGGGLTFVKCEGDEVYSYKNDDLVEISNKGPA